MSYRGKHRKVEERLRYGPRTAERPFSGGAGAWLRELSLIVVLALLISYVVKTFLVQAFYIPSDSMELTLLDGDRVVVNKLVPRIFEVNRGDIVVFTDPGGWLPQRPHAESNVVRDALTFIGVLPQDDGNHLIKRVIGVGGDIVTCCDDQGRVAVNGVSLDETYLAPGALPHRQPFTIKVPEGYLWLMGDNRSFSGDSRMHMGDAGGGSVSEENVVGVAFAVVWPPNRMGLLTNPSEVFEQVPAP